MRDRGEEADLSQGGSTKRATVAVVADNTMSVQHELYEGYFHLKITI